MWLLVPLGIIAAVFLCRPLLIVILITSNPSFAVPVEDKALQRAQEVLSAIKDVPNEGVIATFHADCYAFLGRQLEAGGNEYELTVTAAFDPDDARFLPAANFVNGSWDATVLVHFFDESEVELYFYAGTWEGCKVI